MQYTTNFLESFYQRSLQKPLSDIDIQWEILLDNRGGSKDILRRGSYFGFGPLPPPSMSPPLDMNDSKHLLIDHQIDSNYNIKDIILLGKQFINTGIPKIKLICNKNFTNFRVHSGRAQSGLFEKDNFMIFIKMLKHHIIWRQKVNFVQIKICIMPSERVVHNYAQI